MHHGQSLEPGEDLAGYRVQTLLARGGMGVVYEALDVRLNRLVALKLLAPELSGNEKFRNRFVRESQLAASVDHPNILPVYEAGEADGHLYIAMRFVRGTDLRTVLDTRGTLDLPEAVRVLRDTAAALDAAHAAGLVHRDVKPGNILLAERPDGPPHVYLADFGLTKRSSSATGMTTAGHFLGTLDYVAPEQIRGEDVDGRADVYALACVAYTVLAGHPPFDHEDDTAQLWAHMFEEPPRLSAERPDLPIAVDLAIGAGMAKQREDRPASCGALIAMMGDAGDARVTQAAGVALAGRDERLAPAEPAEIVPDGAAPSSDGRGAVPGGRRGGGRRVGGRRAVARTAGTGPARETGTGAHPGQPDTGPPSQADTGPPGQAGAGPPGQAGTGGAPEPGDGAVRGHAGTGGPPEAGDGALPGDAGTAPPGRTSRRPPTRLVAATAAAVVLAATAIWLFTSGFFSGDPTVTFTATGVPYALEVPGSWTQRTHHAGDATVSVLSSKDLTGLFANDPAALEDAAAAVSDSPESMVGVAVYQRLPDGVAPEDWARTAEAILPGRDAHLVDRGPTTVGDVTGRALDGTMPLSGSASLQLSVRVVDTRPPQMLVFFAPPAVFDAQTDRFDAAAGSLRTTRAPAPGGAR
ncbi:serine/threonine-protein kinase [Georgenia sp. SYP-B2076]|uniref:serine/threonine-protein kinase n=1 Tax=Georgenia sp. SYP-B2076 TaxID=2495881 RepID=UPI0021012F71|nr:serine/threonine-protein kinase [Georgenia sp. SYP-B2076]